MTGQPRTVGILGGMGPEATVLLMQRIIEKTPAQDDRDHVPLIVANNTQVPSRIEALIEGTGADPAPVLSDMARRLETYGAAALAMPCNTAHAYASAIREAATIPFLDMVAGSVATAANVATAKVGLLASPATRMTRLFETALAPHGLAPLYGADEGKTLSAIRALKRSSADPAARTIAQDATCELASAGAEVILVACTEFSLIAKELPHPVPVIDTIDVLADAVIAFSRGADQAV
ncbi:MAG: amino acid racemase [Pseudomonadota bacterium]